MSDTGTLWLPNAGRLFMMLKQEQRYAFVVRAGLPFLRAGNGRLSAAITVS